MKNTLYRFGDSWSVTQENRFGKIEQNHSYYVANHYEMGLNHLGRGGLGNLQIFKKILEQDKNYKKGDIILINFASRSRTEVINNVDYKPKREKQIKKIVVSSSNGDAFDTSNEILQKIVINDLSFPIQDMIFFLIKPYLKSLIDRGINVYHFYNDITDCGVYEIENEINFDGYGYINWCDFNGYKDLTPKGNVHYKVGSQKQIAEKIIELIEKNDK